MPWMMRLDDGTRRAVAGPDMVLLRTAVPLRGEDLKTLGEFTVNAGETVSFTLAYAPSHLPPPTAENPLDQLARHRTVLVGLGRQVQSFRAVGRCG